MTNYTLTYDDGVKGWTSFFSYYPEWMIGMNQFFYSFKGGNLYRHNVNQTRNNFYGVQGISSVTSVFNQAPLENKLFKTINIEGNSPWQTSVYTDLQDGGNIQSTWYEKKEQSWYAYIRNDSSIPIGTDQYALRSLNGIGQNSSAVIQVSGAVRVSFPFTISIGDIISIGDSIYWSSDTSNLTSITYGGIVTDIVVNIPAQQNYIDVSVSPIPQAQAPTANTYIMYAKNSIAESHGLLGHYAVFQLQNLSTSKVELFAVESDVMRSFT